VRIFSGIYAGEGWPACEAHATWAETNALEPLRDGGSAGDDWRVVAYAVDVGPDDRPRMDRRLWIARRRDQRRTA
jgi:hypothetical protein